MAIFRHLRVCAAVALLAPGGALAQTEIEDRELLEQHRPEAWATDFMVASSLFSAIGETDELDAWHGALAIDLAQVPRLDEDQRRVGFYGGKLEDLNRSPVFGRLRAALGLPGGFVAELGYTPPVRIDGIRPEGLVSAALGRRLLARGRWTVSARMFGQHGHASGDITCPEAAVGSDDPELNPFGCEEASKDRVALNYYGAELTAGFSSGHWRWHASAGRVRSEAQVQVDARLAIDLHDRTLLIVRDWFPSYALGVRREFGRGWSAAAEILHVPLGVRRNAESAVEQDPMTSLRLQMRREFGLR